jgi:hypothetical protein
MGLKLTPDQAEELFKKAKRPVTAEVQDAMDFVRSKNPSKRASRTVSPSLRQRRQPLSNYLVFIGFAFVALYLSFALMHWLFG